MKNKIVLWISALVMSSTSVLADLGKGSSECGLGMMSKWGVSSGVGMFGFGLLWLVYLALASFVFSVVFWSTYNWLIKDKRKRKR